MARVQTAGSGGNRGLFAGSLLFILLGIAGYFFYGGWNSEGAEGRTVNVITPFCMATFIIHFSSSPAHRRSSHANFQGAATTNGKQKLQVFSTVVSMTGVHPLSLNCM